MFSKKQLNGYETVINGIQKKTLVHGERTLMTEFRLEAGSQLPCHKHPQEQTGYLVKGKLRMVVGDAECFLEAGDSWCIPGGVKHSAKVLTDAIAIEVFSPVREDYLPKT